MTAAPFSYTTGATVLPDAGTLSYNGCVFGPLFETRVGGTAVKDEAGRTVKYMEYSIEADGYVTLPAGATSINPAMVVLRNLLSAQGGTLLYQGRGMDLVVNAVGAAASRDAAWGPVPEVLEFQPLGGGLSAKIVWKCKVHIPEQFGAIGKAALAVPLLQFNYETSVGYGEDGYTTLSIKGVVEIAITRPTVGTRTLARTVDDVRSQIDSRIMAGIDLTRFRVARRDFNVSRDKRTLAWEIVAEEKPYMDLPPDCLVAHGQYSVRPARQGMGMVTWLCSLRCTYTVRGDRPRRSAWVAFLALLRLRMARSEKAPDPALSAPAPADRGLISPTLLLVSPFLAGLVGSARWLAMLRRTDRAVRDSKRAWLIEFSFDEGLYLDSKTTTFNATWRLTCPLTHILLGSGLWYKPEESDRTLWKTTVSDVMGSRSWLTNPLDAKLDVIVDFGGG